MDSKSLLALKNLPYLCMLKISRHYLRASAITSFVDKWSLCLRKNTVESDISTLVESSETEYESEHESRHPSVMAFSGPHRYWDNYARVLGKESEKKEERKKQEHWKQHKSTERSRVNSKRNEANERKKQTDTKRDEFHDRKKSPDRKRNEAKEKKKANYNKKSRIPTPPALPTKSMMKQATKNAAGYDKHSRRNN
ncbi:UNVERIFIED_CONTAM: hypothetical protein NCL1_35527 [Trichonephila clavipes]